MTPSRLRVLHLEDNSFDQELVRCALLDKGVDCEFVYARTKAEFEAALDREKFDLILSDFTIPGYDGSSALARVQSTCPDVPFVFVSGTIGEDRAIESLKSGAVDYVLKTNLERLHPAVRRALREAGEHAMAGAALAALRRSEERFREMAEHIGSVFYSINLKTGHHAYVSPAYEQIWGLTAAGLHEQPAQWTAAVIPEDRPAVLAALAQLAHGKDYSIEYRIRRPDGTQRWVEDRSYLIREADGAMQRAVGVATDITRRHQLEAQLRQAQKMEAVGQLAGGVAHDFNNVLTVVIGWARLLLDRNTTPPDAIAPLTEIFNAGNRAANLTRQLLVFSNKQTIDRQTVDLNHVTGEISEMLRRLIGEHITLNLALSASPCLAEGDAGMIEQVLMNLAVNARDAMPGGGTLTISTETVVIDDASSHHHPNARPGTFACLNVSDTGCGIPREILSRIFEPFFTTKEVGRGTGLGLAMVTGIVQRHQGWIELESTVGVGTHFRILLPAAHAADHAAADPSQQHPEPSVGGSETILFAEDEPGVREFAVAVLNSLGYRVLQACSGRDALEVWQRHSSRITLLVTDLVMPDGISGVELAIRLRKEKPALKVVLTSGYANGITGRQFQAPANMHFVQKPYKPQALAEAVRTALDADTPPHVSSPAPSPVS
ncbi:MAG TPA: response regulator [Rariglobus sp.]|nr:response regulator [Rariglobus sp.]